MISHFGFPGVFVYQGGVDEKFLSEMDRLTQEWTMQAARGECSWVCADCCMTFPEGMPDACEHGLQGCTDMIQRDKRHSQHANRSEK